MLGEVVGVLVLVLNMICEYVVVYVATVLVFIEFRFDNVRNHKDL
jgi:hypothetical protein